MFFGSLLKRMVKSGARWTVEGFGFGKKVPLTGRIFAGGFAAYSMYGGLREGGVGGAISAGVDYGISTFEFGAALGGLTSPVVWGAAAAIAGTGLAAKYMHDPSSLSSFKGLMRGQTSQFMKKHTDIEMGTPPIDPFGNNATMRQRSLNAIQNSRINGRSALGNEAMILHRPYFL